MAGRIVRAADLVARPWPNGLGTTRDVVRIEGPDGRFAWLVSIADLERDAAFSHFPDCDRVFTLLEGGPVSLAIDGAAPIDAAPLLPVHFPGDRPTASRVERPGRAFNVFVDRRRHRAGVAALAPAPGHAVDLQETAAVHLVAGRARLSDGSALAAGDTWIGPGPRLVADGPALVLAVVVAPVR